MRTYFRLGGAIIAIMLVIAVAFYFGTTTSDPFYKMMRERNMVDIHPGDSFKVSGGYEARFVGATWKRFKFKVLLCTMLL